MPVDELTRLSAIADIVRLKARYCRCIDSKDWVAWRACFVSDVVFENSDFGRTRRWAGVDRVVEVTSGFLAGSRTVHQVHNPEITIVSDREATGLWAMHDLLTWDEPGPEGLSLVEGDGLYTETYRKVETGWLIASTALTRYRLVHQGPTRTAAP